jgi:hypothetical protein
VELRLPKEMIDNIFKEEVELAEPISAILFYGSE